MSKPEPGQIEAVLRTHREIDPSPLFLERVMAAVRAEAALAPLPFPWRRILAGIALLVLSLLLGFATPDAIPPAGPLAVTIEPFLASVVVTAAIAAAALLRRPASSRR